MAQVTGPASAEPRGRRDFRATAAFVLAGLSGGHGVFHWFTQSFIVMIPEIKATFALSDVQVGSMISVRQFASGVITLPGGIISDLVKRQWGLVLALCMGGFGLGWLMMGVSPLFILVLVGLAMIGMASSMWHLPAMASLSSHFSQRRATALSIHNVGGNIGEVAGPIATGFFLAVLSWQGLLTIYSAVPLLLVFVVFWAFRGLGNTGAQPMGDVRARSRAQFQRTRELMKTPLLWAVNAVVAMRGMAYIAFITFLPIYLSEQHGMGSKVFGLYVGLLTFVGILSAPALAYLSDRVGRKLVLVPGLLWLSTMSILLITVGGGVLLTVVILALGLFLFSDQPILMAAALDIVGENVATTTLGVLSFSRFAFSASSPIIAGVLSQAYGVETVFQYTAALFALAAVVLLLLPLRRPGRIAAERDH